MKLNNIAVWGTVFEGKIFPIPAKDKAHKSAANVSRPSLVHGTPVARHEIAGDHHHRDLSGMPYQAEKSKCCGIHSVGGCPCAAAQQVSSALAANLQSIQKR